MRKKLEEKLDRIFLELLRISEKLDNLNGAEDEEAARAQKKILDGMANILSYGEKYGL